MGHPQPPTPIHIDNSTAVGIVNNTIKRQRSRSMEMRYFWLLDQQAQKMFKFSYQPGAENLVDYPSKAHLGTGHQHVRPYYFYEANSPRYLQRAAKRSARRGCAELLADPYHKNVPLPRIPNNFVPIQCDTHGSVEPGKQSRSTKRIPKRTTESRLSQCSCQDDETTVTHIRDTLVILTKT